MASIDWRPWSAEVFARAGRERRPVLLFIGAPWCAATAEMSRTTYADPAVVSLVSDRFVAVHVDADRRPDIAERYALGGYPTTAFLDSRGAIVGGGTFLPAERMRDALRRVADAFASLRVAPVHDSASDPALGAAVHDSASDPTLGAAVHDSASDPALGAAVHDSASDPALGTAGHDSASDPSPGGLVDAIFGSFDAEHGGFGGGPKFPLTAPLELALSRYRESRDPHLARVVETTLDAMGWGPLYDDVDGGFFRCAAARNWGEPRREKLLDVNAALLRLYLDASATLKIARYADRAADVVRYVQTQLADQADGGWAGSQAAEDAYYALPGDGRRARAAPRVDWTFFAAANAAMASAMLHASATLNDASLGEFALRSLERVLLAAYRPGAGVAHYVDDGQALTRGLLDDQIAMASAQLDAYDATGNIVYQMMAQELAHYALRTMWDDADGGFFDRAAAEESECVGLMASRLKPFVANCDAARVLRRLARETGDAQFADRAESILRTMGPRATDHGPLGAHLLLAEA